MSAVAPPQVSVPCPVCGTPFLWPPAAPCRNCHADLAGPVATEFWDLARDMAELQERQHALLTQLAGPAQFVDVRARPARAPHRRLTGLGAQTILGLVGAALLAVAAVVFAAVTWQDLPALARGAILVVAAVSAVILTRWLHRRELAVTAGATGLLADALVATVVWAGHSFGVTGDLVAAGGAALAAAAATGAAIGLSAWSIRWQRWAAAGTWFIAVVFAAVTIAESEGTVAVVAAVLGLVGAGLWLRFAGESVGTGIATVTVTVLALGISWSVTVDDGVRMVAIAAVGLVVVAIGASVGEGRRLPVLVGSLPVNLPAAMVTTALVATTAGGWGRTIGTVWSSTPVDTTDTIGWLAAVPLVVATSLLVLLRTLRPDHLRPAAIVIIPVLATATAWWVPGRTAILAALAGLMALAGWFRIDEGIGRWAFVGGSLVTVGWLLPWAWLTALAATTVVGLAVGARWAPVRRQVEHAAMTVVGAALATSAAVVWVDSTEPGDVAGVMAVLGAVVVAAGAARMHDRLDLHAPAMAWSVAAVGAAASFATGVVADLATAAITTGVVTAGCVALAMVWRGDQLAVRVSAATAALAATVTSWLVLRVADVDVPEAYTAVPAVLALAAGAVWMHHDPLVRSRRALHPGLVLAVAPTLVLLVGDAEDTFRALVAAGFAAVLLLVGVIRRVEVPVWYGLAAAVVVVTTQLAVVAGHVPRWTVFATLGAILVAASATFERQRYRARRLGTVIRRVADDYR